MKNKTILSFLLILSALTLSSFDEAKDWFAAGSMPDAYKMGIDEVKGPDGNYAATIKSVPRKVFGFGTYMQQSKPDQYFGKRVRMSAYIKAEKVKRWAGLWFRVDGKIGEKTELSFDNMGNRPITGTTDWKKYEIVLDVPVGANNLAYGVLLDGTGQVWFDKICFEEVDNTVPATSQYNWYGRNALPTPSNLNFESK